MKCTKALRGVPFTELKLMEYIISLYQNSFKGKLKNTEYLAFSQQGWQRERRKKKFSLRSTKPDKAKPGHLKIIMAKNRKKIYVIVKFWAEKLSQIWRPTSSFFPILKNKYPLRKYLCRNAMPQTDHLLGTNSGREARISPIYRCSEALSDSTSSHSC